MNQEGAPSEEILDWLRRKDPKMRIAVVGASSNPEKYGNRIVRKLASQGYTVVPVNPREKEIEGIPAYSSVTEIIPTPALVNFVVPPSVTLQVLKSMAGSGIETVWFQDGSFDDDVLAYAHDHFKNVIYNACIMVVTSLL